MGRVWNNFSGFEVSSVPARLRCLFSLATIFCVAFLMVCLSNNMEIIVFYKRLDVTSWKNHKYQTKPDERFTISTEGCRIPALSPLAESIKEYVEYPKNIKKCRKSNFTPLENNRTHIWIKQNKGRKFNGYSRLVCCYKAFYRQASIDDVSSVEVDNRVRYSKCVPFTNEIKVSDDFVKIECLNNGKVIYEQFFLFTLKKRLSTEAEKQINKNKSGYNVLVLGIDGVSRLNFHRTMPKTLQFLKHKGAVELLGYNKIGDNTFPNVVPMLLGIKEAELKTTCLPNSRSTFDNCPFVWEWFKQSGYYTAFGEDTSSLGTFNYQRTGFLGTPTDYYLHTFINEAERNAGNNKDFNAFLCMNEKYFFEILLRYIENLAITLKNMKLFGFFWETTMTHDHLNYPMLMDNSYEEFLNRLDVSKYLDETILFLISDHGIRWGEIRFTKQGRLEERLPLVYVLVPQSFRNEYGEAYKNLKLNSRRLTTPFDIHATLYDLINLDNIKEEHIHNRKLKPYSHNRSISLFLPIHTNRTCQMAGIDDHWCTCYRSKEISLTSPEAVTATSHLLRHLNGILRDYRRCAQLKLTDLIEVSELEVGTADQDEIGWREFTIVVRTEPGGGIFEATLRHDSKGWFPTGTVSRLNLYENQSHCMDNYQLKLYCFCI